MHSSKLPGECLQINLAQEKFYHLLLLSGLRLNAITGLAWNFTSMVIIRSLFGVADAGAFPDLPKVVYNWYPLKERGIVQGINFSGSRIGAVFAMR